MKASTGAESPDLVWRPVWLYPVELWSDLGTALGPQHDSLRAAITAELERLRDQERGK